MIHILSGAESLYVKALGRNLKIMAVADNDTDAETFVEANEGAAVVATFGSFRLLADARRHGVTIGNGVSAQAFDRTIRINIPEGERMTLDEAKGHAVSAGADWVEGWCGRSDFYVGYENNFDAVAFASLHGPYTLTTSPPKLAA